MPTDQISREVGVIAIEGMIDPVIADVVVGLAFFIQLIADHLSDLRLGLEGIRWHSIITTSVTPFNFR